VSDPLIDGTFDFAMGAVADALGETITWDPGGAYEKEIRAVFGNGFQRVESGGVRVASKRPEIMVRLSDLPSCVEQGGWVRIRGRDYEIAGEQPDVEGVSTTLVLKVLD
jgi:hypothetical protein